MVRFAVGLSLVLLCASFAQAQDDPAAGILPFSTQAVGPIDSVDLASSNILIRLPIRSKPGAMPYNYELVSNSHAYKGPSSDAGTWQLVSYGFMGQLAGLPRGRIASTKIGTMFCQTQYDNLHDEYVIVDALGGSHPLDPNIIIDEQGCYSLPVGPQTAIDGSGYSAVFSDYFNAQIYDKSGVKNGGGYSDPDGNTIGANDTLGAPTVTFVSGQPGGPDKYQYTDASGATQTVQVNYTSQQFMTTFGCFREDPPFAANFPSSISVPGVGTYGISYEAPPDYPTYVTGRIARITLPYGGSVSYTYGGGNLGHGLDCYSQVVPTLRRTVDDGNGHVSTWTYVNTNDSYEHTNFTVTETDPAGNQTVYNFVGGFQTQAAYYQGSATGTPLKMELTCYNGTPLANCATQSWPGPPIKQTAKYTVYNSTSYTNASKVATTYDCTISPCYGNVMSVAKYDFGQVLRSTTNITYTGCGVGNYIFDRPCSVTTLDGSNNQVSKTIFSYNSKGHATQTQKWVSGTNIYLTSQATYYTNGTLNVSTDANNAQTTYHYNGTGGCNNILPTSITTPDGLTTSQTWDCNGGVITSTSDANSPANVTHFYYADPRWRQTKVTYPDSGETDTTYNDTASTPNIQVSKLISSGHSLSTQTNFDGLGRPIQSLLTSDPNGTVYTDKTYDVMGRVYSVSNPYYTTSDATYGTTVYGYDALSRQTSITHTPDNSQQTLAYSGAFTEVQDEGNGNGTHKITKVNQYDGLGELAAVCEMTTVTPLHGQNTQSCGAFSLNGFLTTYQYDALGNLKQVTQGSETRSFGYDGLSRLTSASNPEASSATMYSYDATGQQGDLYQRVAPAPNVGSGTVTTTYSFDNMHRRTGVSYSDGKTSGVQWAYSQASVWGQAVANPKGHLTSAQVYSNPGNTLIGGEIFPGYDKVGRVTANAQCTPLNCGGTPFNLAYGYDFMGDWTSSNNAMGLTLTYGYNQAAQLVSVTSNINDTNHPPALFSLGTYNALGSLVSANLANGSDARSYDTRGRLKTISTVGPSPGNNLPGKGSVTLSGAEQSNITYGTGTVTIGGTEQRELNGPCKPTCIYIYDDGTVKVTVGGVTDQVTFQQGSTSSSITLALRNAINADSNAHVTATGSGSVLTLTSKVAGSGGNYSLSASVVEDPLGDFIPPSFTATASGSALTGGNTLYDSGTVAVTVGGVQESVTYGQSSTSSSIVTALASKFNGDPNALATASASGVTLNLTAKTTGLGSNYSLSTSVTYNHTFSHASFTATPSGSSFTGGANGEGTVYSLTLGYAPDSNVLTANDINGNWTYTYDDFNRAYTAGNAVGTLSFDYDRYGNRWAQTATGTGNWPQPSFSFDAHNHIVGATYDGAGNLTNDALGHTYFYDAENRLIQVGGTLGQCATATACYAYDGNGRRISKTTGSTTVYYVYDIDGRQVAEVSSAGAWNRGEVYAGGKHLATYDGGATGSMYFNATDWLGNERVRTPVTGPIVETCTNLPFGDDLACTGAETSPMHFTGQQRDTESNLDYFGARYYGSATGRFMTPDPANKGGELDEAESPQSWNAYAYVHGNPLNAVDPDGLDCIYTSGQSSFSVTVEVVRGDCRSSADNGVYVDGTVDVNLLSYNGQDLGYSYANQQEDTGGSGIIGLNAPNPGQLNSFAQGVFSQPSLQIAAATMNDPRTYALWFGASTTLGYGLYAAGAFEGGLTTLELGAEAGGEVTPTVGQTAQVSRQLAEQGKRSLEKSLRKLERRLAEHEAKIQEARQAGGYTSSMEAEVQNFKGLIQAIQNALK